MSRLRWFWDHDGQVNGPLSVSELRHLASTGGLLPTDRVRKEDMDRWVKAQAVRGLFAEPPDGGPAGLPADGDTVFDFFGAGIVPSAEPTPEPLNPEFDFFGTTSSAEQPAPAEVPFHSAAAPTRKSKPPRPSKPVAPPKPVPSDSGPFQITAPPSPPAESLPPVPVSFADFSAEVPMATAAGDGSFVTDVPMATPASEVGIAPPLTGAEVALHPDGMATPTGATVELALEGGWLTARCGGQETHLRLNRVDAVALRERAGAGLVLSVHAGSQVVAARCDGDLGAVRAFIRRVMRAAE